MIKTKLVMKEPRKFVVLKQKTYDLVASQGDLTETFDSTIAKMATFYKAKHNDAKEMA